MLLRLLWWLLWQANRPVRLPPLPLHGILVGCQSRTRAECSVSTIALQALLEAGADPNTEDATGASPFWLVSSGMGLVECAAGS